MPKHSTREQIEANADTLFYEHGFEATSFADIANAVGISRGNFYYHFKSKDDILGAVITRRLAATRAMLDNWEADASPEARIMSFIRILATNRIEIMASGCPVGTWNTELAKLDHAAKARAADIFGLYRDWLSNQFAALGHDSEADALAMHLLGRSQGVAVMASTFRDESFVTTEVASLEDWIQGLGNQPANQRQTTRS